jgi:hypothetical protein
MISIHLFVLSFSVSNQCTLWYILLLSASVLCGGSAVIAMENVWVPEPTDTPRTDLVLGIDLGTSNSCMAVWHEGKGRVKIIKNLRGGR